MAAKRSRLKGLNGTSQERFAGVVARRADRVGCPIGVASERTSTRVKRSAWACGPPGARSGVLGRSPNADALSRSRRSLARHVAASVRDASVSASLTRSYPPTRRNSEAASAPTQLSRAALARTRMCAPEHHDVEATRPARSACRLANINVCYAKRRAGAARAGHRLLVRSVCTRRDRPAVCITPHYVERQHRAAVWLRGASAAMDGRNTGGGAPRWRFLASVAMQAQRSDDSASA